jgi:uncharacterized protein DUF4159
MSLLSRIDGRVPQRGRVLGSGVAAWGIVFLCLVCAASPLGEIARSQTEAGSGGEKSEVPEAEFQMARMKYATIGGAGSHGIMEPWWAIDYPYAEEHFLPALRRLTNLSVSDNERQLELSDDRIFDYPFLFLQQPAQGGWDPTPKDAERLRNYLYRGGFLLVDDFHGEYEWAVFQETMKRVLPDRAIVEIPDNDPLMHVFYDLGDRIQIPGLRHLRRGPGGRIVARMEGPPHWRGIYDDRGRLLVAMNFNMDMGDAWEHADDPYYPAEMTGQAYRLGVNYVIYAMTH